MGVLKGRKRNDGGAGNSTDNADPGGVTAATRSRRISTNGNVGAVSTAPKAHKKAIGAGNNRIVANAPTAIAAASAGTLPGESLLYHKSMLAYPLITTTSRVKSTGSGGSSSVDEDEETLVSKLTDPTALKRSTTNLDGDAANFVGASAAEQKVAADDAKPEEYDDDDNEEGADDGAEADYDEDQVAPSSRLPPHPTTPASHATDPSETYCYLTVPHSSDATKVSSLGDMDSPCRQALIREFTARFGHGPNSQIIDDGFAGQPGNDDNLVDFVEIADGCKDNSKLMIGDMNPVILTTLDPIEAEREMNGEFDERKKKSRAMLSYRPSASSSHQHRQEEPGSATSATLSNSRDPMSSSYDTGKSDTSGWVSPNESPGNKASTIGRSNADCITSSDDAGGEHEDEISRSRTQAEKEEMMLESILNDGSPAVPLIEPLAPPSPQSLEADDEISQCRDELDHQFATSFISKPPFRNAAETAHHSSGPSATRRNSRPMPTMGQKSASIDLDVTEYVSQTSKFNRLGADLISRGKMNEAQSIFRKAISCGRQEMSSLQRRVTLLRESQSIDFSPTEEATLSHRVRHLAAHIADSLNNLGVLYDLLNDYDAAVASCENALDLYISTAGRPNNGTDSDVERTLVNIDQMEEARLAWPQIKRLHQQDEDVARNIQRSTDSSERKRLRKIRLRILGSVLEAERKSLGPNHPRVAESLLTRGLVHVQLGHASASVGGHGSYADGLEEIRNAVHIYRGSLGDKHPDVAQAVAKLAQVYQKRNSSERTVSEGGKSIIRYDPDRALGLYQLSIKVLRASIDNGSSGTNERAAEIAFLLDCIGTIHQNKRNFPEAIEAYSSASAALGGRNRQVRMRQQGASRSVIIDDGGDTHHPLMAKIWVNIGFCLVRKRDYENAIDAFDFALIIVAQNRRKQEITGMVVGDDDGFGVGYGHGLDDYNFLQKECLSSGVGLAIVPEFSDLDSMLLMAQALLSTGKAQSELGWQGKAKTTYEEAGRVTERCLKMLKSCKESSDEDARRSLEVAKLFEALGDVWSLRGSSAAMEHYDKCTGLHRTVGGDDYLAFARLLGKKSALHMRSGEYREAVSILTDVVGLFKTKGMSHNHPDLLNVTTMLRDARHAAERNGVNLSEVPRGDKVNRSGRHAERSTRREIPPSDSASASGSAASSASADLATAFDRKAESMRRAHRYDEAMEACQGALKIRRAQVEEAGTDSLKRKIKIDIGRTTRNEAFLLKKMAEYSKARSLYCKALDLYRLCDLPPSHPYCVTAQRELDAMNGY